VSLIASLPDCSVVNSFLFQVVVFVMSWKGTLFVWRGAATEDSWTGVWVGCEALEVPSNEHFEAETQNTFSSKRNKNGEWESVYRLLDGRRMKSHKEPAMRFEQVDGNSDFNLICRSQNEFGWFVICGSKSDDNVLTMSRRYVDDSDVRVELSLEEMSKWSRTELLLAIEQKKQKKAKISE
jgi:hypothetical protein